MTSTSASFDAAEDTNESPTESVGRPTGRRRRRRLMAGAILALTMVMGSFATGAPVSATTPQIPPPMTNCTDNACAARAGEAAIRAYFGNQGTGSGRATVGVTGCERRGNTCITRYFLVTVELDDGEAILIQTQLRWFSEEQCGDTGVID